MKRLFAIFMVFFSVVAYGQMDTVRVYEGLDISYMFREDTVLMSQRKFNGIVEMLKLGHEDVLRCTELNGKYAMMAELSDKQTKECIEVSRMYEEMSVMYRGAYEYTSARLVEMNDILKGTVDIVKSERRAGLRQGIAYGVVGGLVVGAITAAILLK